MSKGIHNLEVASEVRDLLNSMFGDDGSIKADSPISTRSRATSQLNETRNAKQHSHDSATTDRSEEGIYDLEKAQEVRDALNDLFRPDGTIREDRGVKSHPQSAPVSSTPTHASLNENVDENALFKPLQKTKKRNTPAVYGGWWGLHYHQDASDQEVADIVGDDGTIACHDISIGEIAERIVEVLNQGSGFSDPLILELLAMDNEYRQHMSGAVVNTIKLKNTEAAEKKRFYTQKLNECINKAKLVERNAIERCLR